jgi:chorismate mutase
MKPADPTKAMKPAVDCQDMDDIRTVIDAIDQNIIVQLGQRFAYVKAASKFKTSATDVRAPERFQSMLKQRRQWAEGRDRTRPIQEDAAELQPIVRAGRSV